MTTWLKLGSAIPPCSPRRYQSWTVYLVGKTPERVDEDDGDSLFEQDNGVFIRNAPRRLHDPKAVDRITQVNIFYPWLAVAALVTEQHERDRDHDWTLDDDDRRYRRYEDSHPILELNYPARLAMWCEACNTARALTPEELAELEGDADGDTLHNETLADETGLADKEAAQAADPIQ